MLISRIVVFFFMAFTGNEATYRYHPIRSGVTREADCSLIGTFFLRLPFA